MDIGERASGIRHLIRDRAGQFTTGFDAVLADAGIEVLKIPASCPRANAYAGRFVLTARTELTDQMLILGQRHLQHVLAEYTRHYNRRHPHRGRGYGRHAPTSPSQTCPPTGLAAAQSSAA